MFEMYSNYRLGYHHSALYLYYQPQKIIFRCLAISFIVLEIIVFFDVLDNRVVFSADLVKSPQKKAEILMFSDLSVMSREDLASIDIAEMNLLCAQGLPGSERLDMKKCLKTLDEWSEQVRDNVQKYKRIFDEKPEEFNHSKGEFNMITLITVLQQDCGVKYNEKRMSSVDFKDAKDIFINGMIDGDNGGTCASMPVLYTAIARRLGWPVKLVHAKGHLFCRWEDKNDRFNIEGSGRGFNRYDDEYYMKWPQPISKHEIDAGLYMRSLTPLEELASFLAARGHCLQDNRIVSEASDSYAMAHRLAPESPVYIGFLRNLTSKIPQSLGDPSSSTKSTGVDTRRSSFQLP